LRIWEEWRPDLIVLDIMLPGIDGLSLLRTIRLEDERIPILILSAKGESKDIIQGFTYGVDDYLAKPFNLDEFLLRVDRLLVRASHQAVDQDQASQGIYRFGDNWIDFRTMTAQGVQGRINLTEQEVKLLRLLIAHRGKPVTRSMLLEIALGYPRDTQTRTIDNFMSRFRKYFERNPHKPQYFKSLRSVGYMFEHGSE
jgi:DNA-binding response OmpR family regulator